jgi:UDP-GlcNAc:undecaprenyl-phosphate/decaprenyl-phosphate GlcNAc-1-phosphate transferase
MVFWFISAASAAFVLTYLVKGLALRFQVVDKPGLERKIHDKPMPLMGGVAIYAGFMGVLIIAAAATGNVIGTITWPMLTGVALGGAVIVTGGVWDDIRNLPPKRQIIFPVVGVIIVILSGIGISKLSNPLGGFIELAAPVSAALVFPYLLGAIYATKLSDGLDGLVAGLGAIGSLLIMALALTPKYFQPDVAIISAIAAGAFVGFLFWNFHPAKIFLGEGGATFTGFILGVLSIISGAKIAVALMALGVAVVDAAWVILRRVLWEKKSLASGDRKHLHHRLLDAGLGQRQAVILLWSISAAFGAATLLLQSSGKLVAFLLLAAVTLLVGVAAILKRKRA